VTRMLAFLRAQADRFANGEELLNVVSGPY